MARLSVEHFRAQAAMTPEKSRKPSRIRDMFKSRSSMSPSTPTVKFAPSPAISPLTSPAVKPGFEKVGLLPSERNSLSGAKELDNTAKPAYTQDQGVGEEDKDQATPAFTSPGLRRTVTTDSRKSSQHVIQMMQQQDSEEQNLEEEAAAQKTEINDAKGLVDVTEVDGEDVKPLYVLGPSDEQSMTSDIADLRGCDEDDGTSRYDSKRHSQTGNIRYSTLLDRDDTFVDSEVDVMPPSKRGSFASNIFDDDDPFSQGVREYVASKIAEAKAQFDSKTHEKTTDATKTLRVTLEIPLDVEARQLPPFRQEYFHHAAQVMKGPKTIGKYQIQDTNISKIAQLALLLSVFLALSLALYHGLLVFASVLSVGSCLFIAYVLFLDDSEGDFLPETDLIIAPVLAMIMLVLGVARQILEITVSKVAAILLEAAVRQDQKADRP